MIEKMNLQFFAESEKTEKPTPKKRSEAREEGQIVQSKEVNTVVILFASFLGLKLFGQFMHRQLMDLVVNILSQTINAEMFLNPNNLMINFMNILFIFAITVLPVIAVAFFSALLVNYFQVGFLFTSKTLQLKLNRLNPIEGFKKMFSKRALVDLVKSVLKVVLAGSVAYSYVKANISKIIQYSNMEVLESFLGFSDILYGLILRLLMVLLLLAIFDYFFQWREHEKNLMMTKQEIKEEYKQSEGDPLIKSKIREKQRRLAMSRMMQDIPKADVIITNPTHYAIAIKYDQSMYDAPYVIGKGMDLVAENIKKMASENNVPIVENKPLARAIYDTIDIGDVITEDLYEAVAEVLAYVYSLREEF
ncbi:MAG: flagellar biosynthesis protein FlhB [Tissierellaceae bacterium]